MSNMSPFSLMNAINNSAQSPAMTVYLDSAPYPEVTGAKDPETVALIKEDYAGVTSELTAITSYIYQNITSDEDPSFASAILQIALVEMTHLDMLGDAIMTLGGNPSFGNGKHFWQASSVDYANTIPAMLKSDIASETKAIENYQKHAAATKNPSVRTLLLRIVEDEKLHLRFFNETLAKMTK